MASPQVVTSLEAYRELAETAPKGARIPVEVQVTVDDPFEAYKRVRKPGRSVFLETSGSQQGWGYLGVSPTSWLTVSNNPIPRQSGADADVDSPTLSEIEAMLAHETLIRGACDVPYPCGLIGWLSYDIARELEDLQDQTDEERDLPLLQLGFFDRLAAWRSSDESSDKVRMRVTSCPRRSGPAVSDYERAKTHAVALAESLDNGTPRRPSPPVPSDAAGFESECDRESFADRVRRVKRYIRDGDTFQTNISQRLRAPAAVHPTAVYEALRDVNPAPYSGLLEYGSVDLVSASPELLVERRGRFIRTEPIAGTRPRGADDASDRRLESDLLADPKERAEHAMLVDLERNDLGKICSYGSVEVDEYRRIDRYSEVMHLVSNVTGRLRPEATIVDVIAAVFPGGTITGAPKPRTMEIIEEVESTKRGPYTGSIGLFGIDDRATLNIVIRTIVRHADTYYLRVGAGIVHDSDPYREYDETLDKARALLNAMNAAIDSDVEVTLLSHPGEGDGPIDDRGIGE